MEILKLGRYGGQDKTVLSVYVKDEKMRRWYDEMSRRKKKKKT